MKMQRQKSRKWKDGLNIKRYNYYNPPFLHTENFHDSPYILKAFEKHEYTFPLYKDNKTGNP